MAGKASTFLQFRLLLWKNFVLRRRRPILLAMELLSPIAIIAVLALVRTRNLRELKLPCHFRAKPMPSAGTLPWLQHVFCDFNNTCFAAPLDTMNNDTNNITGRFSSILNDGRLSTNGSDGFLNLTNVFSILRDISINSSQSNKPVSYYLTNGSLTRSNLQTVANVNMSDAGWGELTSMKMSTARPIITNPFGLSNSLSNNCNISQFYEFLNVSSGVEDLHSDLCNLTNIQIFLFNGQLNRGINFQLILNESSTPESTALLQSELERNRDGFSSIFTVVEDLMGVLTEIMPSGNSGNRTNNTMLAVFRLVCGENSDIYRIIEKSPNAFDSKKDKNSTVQATSRRRKRSVDSESAECQKFFNDPPMNILLKGMRPLLTRKVYYTPDTEITRTIVKNSNSTFDGLVRFTTAIKQWNQGVSKEIQAEMYNGTTWNFLRSICPILNRTEICNFLENDPSDPDQSNWQNFFEFLDPLIKQLENIVKCFDFDKFVPMSSESEMLEVMNEYEDYWAGVVFEGFPDNPNSTIEEARNISIRIRMNTSMVDTTLDFKVLDRFWTPGVRRNPAFDLKYFTYGFIFLQEMLGRGVSQTITGEEVTHSVNMQQFPYPCYVNDKFTTAISRMLPMFLVLGWIVSVSMTVRAIVYEKEHRMKEIMKVMGLTNGVHWLGWFTTTSIIMTASVIVISLLMKFGRILYFSSGLVVFFFIYSFMIASIMQAFLFSVFFGKANIAAVCSGIFFFVLYLPYVVVQINEESINEAGHFGFSILSQVAFSIGCRYLAAYEQQGVGIQFNNIWVSPSSDDPFNLGKSIIMLWVDALFYWLLTWYIEAVFPGKFGVPRVWYFPFTREYWCGSKENRSLINNNNEEGSRDLEIEECIKQNFEKDPENVVVGVSIKNLSKSYKKGIKPAVDGLNLDFFENQITSFLGHNGAGKTTTISILTGLFTPTSGTAYIYGRNIRSDMDAIRNNLGLCPQHNVLFEYLTVEEHIYFYGLLKGMPGNQIQSEIDKFVEDVGLPQKRKELSMKLSGGMKRKLSVAMAFVGGSKVVILDEPTAGVDPYARRSIWDLLVSCRKDRTVILTTHHMDEADVLGDRVAIISQGSLKCCGSSLFLKNVIGTGYNLILVKANVDLEDPEIMHSTTSKLTEYISKHVNGSELSEDTITEWVYQLPRSGLDKGEFQNLFEALDNNLVDLGISSYGIADTSLEEVFLKVAHDPSDEYNQLTNEKLTDGGTYARPVTRDSFRESGRKKGCFSLKKMTSSKVELVTDEPTNEVLKPDTVNCGAGSYSVTGCALLRMQFIALWIKRFHNMKRNKRGFVAEMVVPTIFILLAVILSSITPGVRQNPPMPIQPWLLMPKRGDAHLNVFYSNANTQNSSNAVTDKLTEMIRTPLGLGGVRCMNSSVCTLSRYPCMPSNNLSMWSAVPKGETPLVIPFCTCQDSGSFQCPKPGTRSPIPSFKLMKTTDKLHNLTGFNESDWILTTTKDYVSRRYGGFVFGFNEVFDNSRIVSLAETFLGGQNSSLGNQFWENVRTFVKTATPFSGNNATVWFDNNGYVASTAYLAILQNSLMRLSVPNDRISDFGFSFVNHPMNLSDEQLEDRLYRMVAIDMLISVCVVFALAFIPASFLLFLIEERVSNSKHLQFVSGVNPYVYWIANYLWDIVNYIIPCCICIIIFVIFDRQSYISSDNAGTFILLLMLYGITIIPLMYQASFVFSTPSTAFVIVSSLNLLLGLLSTLAVFIIESLEEDDQEMKDINDILKKVFLVLPQYCLGRSLFELAQMNVLSSLEEFSTHKERLAWENIGIKVFCLCVQCVFFLLCVVFIERNCWCSQRQGRMKNEFVIDPDDMDEDVRVERERVQNKSADSDSVRLLNLTKVYPGKKAVRPAVNDLCLGIRSGECFGFLGVNGAGKTTTFKMLTGQESVTKGDAAVCGFSVISNLIEVHKRVGYCPQFDALNNLLTGRETLWLFCRLRGIPKEEIADVVDWALSRLSLQPHADKPAGAYSGGNKRKLSTAVALIGNPSVIFLDEPTSGMDPGARRFLWNCILKIVKEGRSVVLTTHSMEECEALSQRLCIMVNGTLKCLGSVQHLKTKFGKGYTLSMKLNNSTPRFDETVEFMKTHLPNAILSESNYTLLEYQLPSDLKLGQIFSLLQKAKVELKLVDDYSVSQTTLDQVFINFAKHQSDEDGCDAVDEGLVQPVSNTVVDAVENPAFEDFSNIEFKSNNNETSDEPACLPMTPV